MPPNALEESLGVSARLLASQLSTVLGLLPDAVSAVPRDHLSVLFGQVLVELVTVARMVADQILWRFRDHVEVEGQEHQRYSMIIGGVRRDGQRRRRAKQQCRLVVRAGLKPVALRAGFENPQHDLENPLRGNRRSARTMVGIVLARKVPLAQFPLFFRYA